MTGSQSSQPATAEQAHRSFWAQSTMGRVGVAVFVANFVLAFALVNVVQVPFLGWVLAVASVGLLGAARFRMHDRSTSVAVLLVLSAIAVTFSVLFLAGEVFIGHD